MVDKAAFKPAVAQRLIEREGLSHLGFSEVKNEKISFVSNHDHRYSPRADHSLQMNGVPLSLYPSMMQVDCARLPFPEVKYKYNRSYALQTKGFKGKAPATNNEPAKKQSVWNLRPEEAFHDVKAKSLNYFVIQTLDQTMGDTTTAVYVTLFGNALRDQMERRCNMPESQVKRLNQSTMLTVHSNTRLNNAQLLDLRMQEAKGLKADLFVLILPSFDRHLYASFKDLADRKYGLRSICLAKPAQLKNDISKYMTNIAHKINLKTGGVNSLVQEVPTLLGRKTLVLGADVVHPGMLAYEDSPSIACIVGSIDNLGGQFRGSARLQSKDKKDREVSQISGPTGNMTDDPRSLIRPKRWWRREFMSGHARQAQRKFPTTSYTIAMVFQKVCEVLSRNYNHS
jgi:hypothetical protein